MKWIIITHADLEAALNKPQLDLLRAAELSSPGRDIAADIISSVTSRVRAEIAACDRNSLDPDHLRIPPELKECALSLVLEAMQARLPTMRLGDIAEKRAALARETLSKVAACELPVTRPIGGIRAASRKGIAVCSSRKNRIGRSSMEGL